LVYVSVSGFFSGAYSGESVETQSSTERRARRSDAARFSECEADSAAGYRGYLDGHLAPDNLSQIIARASAVRWHRNVMRELGNGAAYAVTDSGFGVGATAVAGRFEAETTNVYGDPSRSRYYTSRRPRQSAGTSAV
jgi:hypothetical protein